MAKLKYDWNFENPPVPGMADWDSSRDFFLSSGGGEGNAASAEAYNRRAGAESETEGEGDVQ